MYVLEPFWSCHPPPLAPVAPRSPAIHFHNKIVTNGPGNKIWREIQNLCERNVIIYVETWDFAGDNGGNVDVLPPLLTDSRFK